MELDPISLLVHRWLSSFFLAYRTIPRHRPYYLRDNDANEEVFLGTEGGKGTGNDMLGVRRTANPAHIAGGGTDAEQSAARTAALTNF